IVTKFAPKIHHKKQDIQTIVSELKKSENEIQIQQAKLEAEREKHRQQVEAQKRIVAQQIAEQQRRAQELQDKQRQQEAQRAAEANRRAIERAQQEAELQRLRINRITCLQSTSQNKCGYIPEYLRQNAQKFIRLQSLTITINSQQTNIIYRILRKLPSLEYLSITCNIQATLLKNILSISTLRIFQLHIKEFLWNIINPLHVNSNIEIFYIHFLYVIDYRLVNCLLASMSKLKQLDISSNHDLCISLNRKFNDIIFNLVQLRTIKFQGSEHILCIFLKQLQTKIHNLQRLHLNIKCRFFNEDFFRNLIFYWYPIWNKIEKVYFRAEGYILSNDSKQTNQYKKILTIQNKELNNCFKIQWIQPNYQISLNTILIISK
ncbi:unnamed protein product, partial [Adineta steineri]